MTAVELHIAERLLGHLRAGTADSAETDLRLPAWHYFDEGHAARERALFLRTTLLATVSSALPAPGSFVTLDLIGVPLLLVRQEDGSLAGFRNVCRHRGVITREHFVRRLSARTSRAMSSVAGTRVRLA